MRTATGLQGRAQIPFSSTSQAQHPSDSIAYLLLIFGPALAPHLSGLYVGGTLVVGFGQHAHDGDQYLLDRLDRAPPLRRVFVVVGVVAWGVQDGDADEAAGVDYRERERESSSAFWLVSHLSDSGAEQGSGAAIRSDQIRSDQSSGFAQHPPLGWKTSPRNFIVGGARG